MTDHDILNRYLDDLANGKTVTTSEVRPDLAETIHRLHEIGSMPLPDSNFIDHLEDTLMNAGSSTHAFPLLATPSSQLTGPSALARPVGSMLSLGRAKRLAPLLLAAAMLLVAVGLVINRLDPGGRFASKRPNAPAILAPATPPPDALADVTVLEITLPVDALPTGEGVSAGLGYVTIRPGASSSWVSKCCRGPNIEYVVSGQYTVTVAAGIDVTWADGTVEHVPANTEVTLGPGDSLISRNETDVVAANNGTEPVELMHWILVDDSGEISSFRGHLLPGWIDGISADVQGPLALGTVPVVIELRRIAVQDRESVAAPEDGLQFVVPAEKGSWATYETDGSTRILGQVGQPVTVYVLTVTQAGTESGTPAP